MEIKSTITHLGKTFDLIYQDIDSEAELDERKVKHVHALCFYNDKLVIVCDGSKNRWGPPGGSVEKDEDVRSAVRREVKEETNMNVLKQRFIGFQDIYESTSIISQTRSVCIVEPYGPFVSDPDGDITEIKLIYPKDYKQYFDWGQIGDHIMERALELKKQMDLEIDYVK